MIGWHCAANVKTFSRSRILCYHTAVTRRRLILYLLLNVLVSALVTGAILFLHERFGNEDCPSGVGAASGVTILGVSGMGELSSEVIILQNSGDAAVVLTGWVLRDSEGAAFTLPQLTLFPGGTVLVHSAAGEDTIADLYWGSNSPLWTSGELVVLYDTQNLARAIYSIP